MERGSMVHDLLKKREFIAQNSFSDGRASKVSPACASWTHKRFPLRGLLLTCVTESVTQGQLFFIPITSHWRHTGLEIAVGASLVLWALLDVSTKLEVVVNGDAHGVIVSEVVWGAGRKVFEYQKVRSSITLLICNSITLFLSCFLRVQYSKNMLCFLFICNSLLFTRQYAWPSDSSCSLPYALLFVCLFTRR